MRPLPFVSDVGNNGEPVFIGSDVSGRSIRAAHANLLTALNTSPGGAGRRRALKRLTKFTRGDFQSVEPTVPQGATIVRAALLDVRASPALVSDSACACLLLCVRQ